MDFSRLLTRLFWALRRKSLSSDGYEVFLDGYDFFWALRTRSLTDLLSCSCRGQHIVAYSTVIARDPSHAHKDQWSLEAETGRRQENAGEEAARGVESWRPSQRSLTSEAAIRAYDAPFPIASHQHAKRNFFALRSRCAAPPVFEGLRRSDCASYPFAPLTLQATQIRRATAPYPPFNVFLVFQVCFRSAFQEFEASS